MSRGAAFVTGGSSGIGLALAQRLAARGHAVALFARGAERLQEAADAIRAACPGAVVEVFPVDLGDTEACAEAVARATGALGPPHWAIANAGIAVPGLFLDQPVELFARHMQTNYMGALAFAKAAVPQMAPGSRLVFVASGAAFFGIHGYSAYAPSKFALRGLAEVLRVELAPRGIGVTLAYPPDTDTPQLAAEAETKPAATKEITAGAGVWSADDVAALILRRADAGRFVAAPGLQMTVLSALHSALAPALRAWQGRIVRRHGR